MAGAFCWNEQRKSFDILQRSCLEDAEILLLEPLYGGPYKQLMDLLAKLPRTCLFTLQLNERFDRLPTKRLHSDINDFDCAVSRVKTSALHFSALLPESSTLKTLFTSSVLNLCELVAMRPDLGKLHKIIYFHENQIVYPLHHPGNSTCDFQFGYNEIVSCLAADVVVFNSEYHRDMFLLNIDAFLRIRKSEKLRLSGRTSLDNPNYQLPPDDPNYYLPKNIAAKIGPKCRVLYFPIEFHRMSNLAFSAPDESGAEVGSSIGDTASEATALESSEISLALAPREKLHIVWPYQWEQDKNPNLFFKTLSRMKSQKDHFKVTILGGATPLIQKPDLFDKAYDDLDEQIAIPFAVWGSREYYQVLRSADVVVSTSKRLEFHSAAILEAVEAGCTPLCFRGDVSKIPALKTGSVYEEFLPESCLYRTNEHLYRSLKRMVKKKMRGEFRRGIGNDFGRFSWDVLKNDYEKLLYDDPGG